MNNQSQSTSSPTKTVVDVNSDLSKKIVLQDKSSQQSKNLLAPPTDIPLVNMIKLLQSLVPAEWELLRASAINSLVLRHW